MRIWSLSRANAALPEVRSILAQARTVQVRVREALDHLEDLRILHGDAVDAEAPEEAAHWRAAHAAALEDLEAAMLKFDAMGVEPKDLDVGLVDFRSRLGELEVYLCWRDGEPEIKWWHSLDGGFARRRPIPDFTPVG